MRKAKIVGTLGPSSDSVDKIAELIRAGLNVARINMSHGTHEGHEQVIKNVREASRLVEREVAILLDLQGPKIRVDKLPTPLKLEDGSTWVIGHSDVKDQYPEYKDCFIPTIYEDLVNDCEDGTRILFDDGYITATALSRDRDVYKIKIQVGGELKSNKGINLPDADVSAPSFTKKDHEDLMFGLTQEIDYVALSFVRKKEDILHVMNILHKLKLHIPIVAKIEKPQAVENLDEIMEVFKKAKKENKDVARVHTGDPMIYGSTAEQMRRLDDLEIEWEVIPGVSSFVASAAAIGKELTLPETSQTIILTRMEGRTPMPEGEKLADLAKTGATLALFLSVGLIKKVVDELKTIFDDTHPVIVVQRASWPDQKIVRGDLSDIVKKVKNEKIKSTAIILTGKVFNTEDFPDSRLYASDFTHNFRQAKV